MEPTISHTSGYEPWPIARGFCERPNTFHFTFLYAFKMCYQFSSIFLRIFNASLPFKDIVHCSRRSLFLGFISPPKKKRSLTVPIRTGYIRENVGHLPWWPFVLFHVDFERSWAPQLTTITLQGIKMGWGLHKLTLHPRSIYSSKISQDHRCFVQNTFFLAVRHRKKVIL